MAQRMKKYDEITLNEISKMPFVPMPSIRLNLGTIESITDVALRNGIDWRKCIEILHALDRDPNFGLRWYDGEDGTSVRVDLKPNPRS